MDEPKRTVAARTASLKESAERRSKALEQARLVNFPVAVYRRFKKIEGSHLALVIGANAFVAVIPLLIIGYAFLEAFNPDRSIGTVLVERFHLSGATAQTVRDTFTTAKAGKSVALSIGLISLLITGVDIAGTVGTAYAPSVRDRSAARLATIPPRLDLARPAPDDDLGDLDAALLGVEPAVVVPRRPAPRWGSR